MTVYPIEHANQVAEFGASRDVQADHKNAERLTSWKMRYPRDAVAVPEASEPPNWPARRSSIDGPATVTDIRAGRAA